MNEVIKAAIVALEQKAEFWRVTTYDPHNIANSVMTACLEVRSALQMALVNTERPSTATDEPSIPS